MHPPLLISCIVPVYNGERYLKEALESILAQTYQPVEIIVVDDGSTDGTPEVMASYGNQVHYVQQANAGPATARNLGVETAQGELIAFLDADDVWHPEKLARQAKRFAARPELDLCVTHIQNFWDSERQEEAEQFRDHRLAQPLPGYVTQTLLTRRSVFKSMGQFNPALRHADAKEWFLRVAEQGAVIEQLLSGSDNMLDLLEKQKIEILRVIFIDLKKDTKCDLL